MKNRKPSEEFAVQYPDVIVAIENLENLENLGDTPNLVHSGRAQDLARIAFDSLPASMMSDALKAIVELEEVDITAARKAQKLDKLSAQKKGLRDPRIGVNTQERKANG